MQFYDPSGLCDQGGLHHHQQAFNSSSLSAIRVGIDILLGIWIPVCDSCSLGFHNAVSWEIIKSGHVESGFSGLFFLSSFWATWLSGFQQHMKKPETALQKLSFD